MTISNYLNLQNAKDFGIKYYNENKDLMRHNSHKNKITHLDLSNVSPILFNPNTSSIHFFY